MATNLEEIMKIAQAAQAAASAIVPATASSATQVATRGTDMSLDDILSNGMSVDVWLKVNASGMFWGNSPKPLFDDVIVDIDMTEVVPHMAFKYVVNGQPPIYKKSRDGVSVVGGGSWEDAKAQAKRLTGADPEVYTSVDVPMILVEDFKDSKGVVIVEAGTAIGLTTSTTNFKPFKVFLKEVAKKNLKSGVVRVKLTHQSREGKGFSWGIINFNLIGPADEMAEAA